ncbi:MAG TPA: LacI family DNA-binding transcriptional regulator [Amnibacterium sp.]|jgi:DNA-binding LacI/PurR family transcriptional regulator|nr:LacI family DNA-binding transcriptional regulator [Amnibacterium sp.]
MTSIHDVARHTGVSTATVSRALRGLPNVSPKTREAVQAAAAELGYVPSPSAAGLSSGRHRAIAMVVPSMGRWFYTEVVEGVDSVLRREGYDAFLIDLAIGPGKRQRLFHNSLLRKRADAVIALGIDFSKEERRELRSLAMPSIIVGAAVRGVRSVGVDDQAATVAAMEHLLGLGHTRIAHIGGEDEYGMDYTVALARRSGWGQTLQAHGLTPRVDWFASGGFLMPQAKVAAQAVLSPADRPTAIFAGSDEMAFGVLVAAQELGLRVPEDLSVIGIDDHSWSETYGLTTIRQNPHEQGAVAAKLMLDELGGVRTRQRVIRADWQLVVRRTTAPPRAHGDPATLHRPVGVLEHT